MCSQLKHLFRIDMKGNTLIEYLESFVSNITEIHLWTTRNSTLRFLSSVSNLTILPVNLTVFALLCIGFIFFVRRVQRRYMLHYLQARLDVLTSHPQTSWSAHTSTPYDLLELAA